MKRFFSKKWLALLIAPAFLLSFSVFSNLSFSGDWALNESKSDLGQFPNFVPRKIKVDQKDDGITITKTSQGFNGEDVIQTETLTFDGKEIESTIFGSSKRKASEKWSDDGQTLTITFSLALDFNGQITEVTGKEVWTQSDAGKTFTLQSNSSSSFGDNAYKAVYGK
ncbi:MAG: hypothetical protein ABUT20_23165 [Bacteroidota bacterium]